MGWKALAASVTGRNHEQHGLGNDDAFRMLINDGGLAVLAVADGAGSHSGTSALGSWTACESAVASIQSHQYSGSSFDELDDEATESVMRSAFDDAWQQLCRVADENSLCIRDLSTTLIVAVLGEKRGVVGQLGDGITVVQQGDQLEWILAENKEGYANETHFLTSEREKESVRVSVLNDVTAVALSTDGLEYKICELADRRPYVPFFTSLWDRMLNTDVRDEQLSQALKNIPNDQTGDDLTLVTVVSADNQPREAFSEEPARQGLSEESAQVIDFESRVPSISEQQHGDDDDVGG